MLESLPESQQPRAFCNLRPDRALLHETPDFYVIAGHAPLTPGHALLVPKLHARCLAELPASLDGEFARLKARCWTPRNVAGSCSARRNEKFSAKKAISG